MTLYLSLNGKMVREYQYYVDLIPGRFGYDCEIMTHVPTARADYVAKGIVDRGYTNSFDVKWMPCNAKYQCLVAKPVFTHSGEPMKGLLNYFDTMGLPIKWKEGAKGYLIDKLGNIKKIWDLDKVTVAKVVDVEIVS